MRWRGGCRLNQLNCTWPFATLEVTGSASLELRYGVPGLADGEVAGTGIPASGTFVFRAEEVAELRPVTFTPLIGRGIQIRHHREDYPERVIFWCFTSPRKTVQAIETQFRPAAPETGASPVATPGMAERIFSILFTLIGLPLFLWFLGGFVLSVLAVLVAIVAPDYTLPFTLPVGLSL